MGTRLEQSLTNIPPTGVVGVEVVGSVRIVVASLADGCKVPADEAWEIPAAVGEPVLEPVAEI